MLAPLTAADVDGQTGEFTNLTVYTPLARGPTREPRSRPSTRRAALCPGHPDGVHGRLQLGVGWVVRRRRPGAEYSMCSMCRLRRLRAAAASFCPSLAPPSPPGGGCIVGFDVSRTPRVATPRTSTVQAGGLLRLRGERLRRSTTPRGREDWRHRARALVPRDPSEDMGGHEGRRIGVVVGLLVGRSAALRRRWLGSG